MDYELSSRYQDRVKRIRSDSWEDAGYAIGGVIILILCGALVAVAMMDPWGRWIMGSILVLTAIYFALRYAIVAWKVRKLRDDFAKEAMLR